MRAQRKISVQPATRPNADINVTPLVDVVLVLLIIFMVVTPLLEKEIEVRVPATEQVEEVAEVPRDQLVVGIDGDGKLSINTEAIGEAEYVERLRRVLAARARGDRLVFFLADDGANYARVVRALDGARQAGAETLGMMTELPEGAGGHAAAPPAN